MASLPNPFHSTLSSLNPQRFWKFDDDGLVQTDTAGNGNWTLSQAAEEYDIPTNIRGVRGLEIDTNSNLYTGLNLHTSWLSSGGSIVFLGWHQSGEHIIEIGSGTSYYDTINLIFNNITNHTLYSGNNSTGQQNSRKNSYYWSLYFIISDGTGGNTKVYRDSIEIASLANSLLTTTNDGLRIGGLNGTALSRYSSFAYYNSALTLNNRNAIIEAYQKSICSETPYTTTVIEDNDVVAFYPIYEQEFTADSDVIGEPTPHTDIIGWKSLPPPGSFETSNTIGPNFIDFFQSASAEDSSNGNLHHDYYNNNYDNSFDITILNSPFTIEWWATINQYRQGSDKFINLTTTTEELRFQRAYRNGPLELWHTTQGTDGTYTITEDITDSWHHIALRYTGTAYELVIDGIQRASITTSMTFAEGDEFKFGATGYISRVAIYDVVKNDAWLLAHMQDSTTATYYETNYTQSLIADADMAYFCHPDEVTGSQLNDLSGNAAHATLYNSPTVSADRGIQLDGVNQRISVPIGSSTDTYTIFFVIRNVGGGDYFLNWCSTTDDADRTFKFGMGFTGVYFENCDFYIGNTNRSNLIYSPDGFIVGVAESNGAAASGKLHNHRYTWTEASLSFGTQTNQEFWVGYDQAPSAGTYVEVDLRFLAIHKGTPDQKMITEFMNNPFSFLDTSPYVDLSQDVNLQEGWNLPITTIAPTFDAPEGGHSIVNMTTNSSIPIIQKSLLADVESYIGYHSLFESYHGNVKYVSTIPVTESKWDATLNYYGPNEDIYQGIARVGTIIPQDSKDSALYFDGTAYVENVGEFFDNAVFNVFLMSFWFRPDTNGGTLGTAEQAGQGIIAGNDDSGNVEVFAVYWFDSKIHIRLQNTIVHVSDTLAIKDVHFVSIQARLGDYQDGAGWEIWIDGKESGTSSGLTGTDWASSTRVLIGRATPTGKGFQGSVQRIGSGFAFVTSDFQDFYGSPKRHNLWHQGIAFETPECHNGETIYDMNNADSYQAYLFYPMNDASGIPQNVVTGSESAATLGPSTVLEYGVESNFENDTLGLIKIKNTGKGAITIDMKETIDIRSERSDQGVIIQGSFKIENYIQQQGTASTIDIFDFRGDFTSTVLKWTAATDTAYFRNSIYDSNTASCSRGKWHHFMIKIQGGERRYFLDGVYVDEINTSNTGVIRNNDRIILENFYGPSGGHECIADITWSNISVHTSWYLSDITWSDRLFKGLTRLPDVEYNYFDQLIGDFNYYDLQTATGTFNDIGTATYETTATALGSVSYRETGPVYDAPYAIGIDSSQGQGIRINFPNDWDTVNNRGGVSLWIRITSWVGTGECDIFRITDSNGGTGKKIVLKRVAGQNQIYLTDENGQSTGNLDIVLGGWYHIAAGYFYDSTATEERLSIFSMTNTAIQNAATIATDDWDKVVIGSETSGSNGWQGLISHAETLTGFSRYTRRDAIVYVVYQSTYIDEMFNQSRDVILPLNDTDSVPDGNGFEVDYVAASGWTTNLSFIGTDPDFEYEDGPIDGFKAIRYPATATNSYVEYDGSVGSDCYFIDGWFKINAWGDDDVIIMGLGNSVVDDYPRYGVKRKGSQDALCTFSVDPDNSYVIVDGADTIPISLNRWYYISLNMEWDGFTWVGKVRFDAGAPYYTPHQTVAADPEEGRWGPYGASGTPKGADISIAFASVYIDGFDPIWESYYVSQAYAAALSSDEPPGGDPNITSTIQPLPVSYYSGVITATEGPPEGSILPVGWNIPIDTYNPDFDVWENPSNFALLESEPPNIPIDTYVIRADDGSADPGLYINLRWLGNYMTALYIPIRWYESDEAISLEIPITWTGSNVDLYIPIKWKESDAAVSLEIPITWVQPDVSGFPRTSESWKPYITIDGVDFSDRLFGSMSIDFEEDASGIAKFNVVPNPNFDGTFNIDIMSWISKKVIIDIAIIVSGSEVDRVRRFTGLISNAEFDIEKRFIKFTGLTDLQGYFENMEKDDIKTILGVGTTSYWSEYVFNNEELTGWEHAQDIMATQPKCIWLDRYRMLRLDDWVAKAIPDFTFTDNNRFDNTLDLNRATRRDLINKVRLNADYRFFNQRQRDISWHVDYQYNSACKYLTTQYELLSKDDVQSAIENSGWVLQGEINYSPFFPPGNVYCPEYYGPGYPAKNVVWLGAPDNYVRGTWFSLSKRWVQALVERYNISIEATDSIEYSGELIVDRKLAVESDYDGTEFEDDIEYTAPMQGATQNDIGDWVLPVDDFVGTTGTRLDFENAQETIIAYCKNEILGSHRKNELSFDIPFHPLVDLKHTVQVEAVGALTAKGKVRQVIDNFNIENGTAKTNVILALSAHGGTGLASDDPIVPALQPLDTTTETPYTAWRYMYYHIGGLYDSPLFDETWEGWITNTTISGGQYADKNNPAFNQYETQFVIITPEISGNILESNNLQQDTSLEVEIPEDVLVITA